jgi:hypothetical protein
MITNEERGLMTATVDWCRIIRAVSRVIECVPGATRPHGKTILLRKKRLERYGGTVSYHDLCVIAAYLKIIQHNPGTLDPNKGGAEMTTVTHTMYVLGSPLSGHMTNGVVVSKGSVKTTVKWPCGKCGIYLNRNLKETKPMPQAAHAFTEVQYGILAFLLGAAAKQARTDMLALQTKVSTQNVAHEGLGLRENGIVSTTNDGSRYQMWTLTKHGEFVAGEIHRRVKAAKEAQAAAEQAAKKSTEWIIWSPQSAKPPTVRHSCEQEAMAVAESMATRYPGQQFLCCEIHAGFKLVSTKREKVVYETVTKMEQI